MSRIRRFTVPAKEVVEKVKHLIHEGNVRRVCVMHQGKAIIEIPMAAAAPATLGTGVVAPLAAAIASFATMVSECTIEVEKSDDVAETQENDGATETGEREEATPGSQ